MADKTFDWYRIIVELGNFEVEHGRTRFYENSKLHLAIGAGSLGLASYSVAHNEPLVLVLVLLVSAFGMVNAVAWLRQLEASSYWEHQWRRAASELEQSAEFRAAVGAAAVRVWSHEGARTVTTGEVRPGATANFYRGTVWPWMVFYGAIAIYSAARLFRYCAL